MPNEGSVTDWIIRLQENDESAARNIWERYSLRLLALARNRIQDAPRRVADEEDVVAKALGSFLKRAQDGKFPKLDDRDDLWFILVSITERKALNQMRDQARLKRGGGNVRGDSLIADSSGKARWDQVSCPEPTPHEAAILSESMEALLGMLSDELRRIAMRKLEGYTNQEVATNLNCAISTVERRLRLIRRQWEEHVA